MKRKRKRTAWISWSTTPPDVSRYDVEMPIATQMAAVLDGRIDVGTLMELQGMKAADVPDLLRDYTGEARTWQSTDGPMAVAFVIECDDESAADEFLRGAMHGTTKGGGAGGQIPHGSERGAPHERLLGRPEVLYERPVNTFVANFIADEGETVDFRGSELTIGFGRGSRRGQRHALVLRQSGVGIAHRARQTQADFRRRIQ